MEPNIDTIDCNCTRGSKCPKAERDPETGSVTVSDNGQTVVFDQEQFSKLVAQARLREWCK